MGYENAKQQVLACARRLVDEGFLVGSGGNVSMRVDGEDRLAITPTGREYRGLDVGDICLVGFGLELLEGASPPSSETALHVSVYRGRPDVNAIIHTHQLHAAVLSLIGQPVPALFDEQVANLGNQVAVVPYGLSGSVELTTNVTAAVASGCNAFILQNHGALVLGLDLERAARNVQILEKAAGAYYLALLTNRPVTTLPSDIEATLMGLLTSEQRREARRKRRLERDRAATDAGADAGEPT